MKALKSEFTNKEILEFAIILFGVALEIFL